MRYEKLSLRSILGIRFRDAATERPVTDGLQVTIFPENAPQRKRQAVTTVSGTYVARRIPGLRSYEHVPADIPDHIPADAPAVDQQGTYLIDIRDNGDRFVPALLRVTLPYAPDPAVGGLLSIAETPSDMAAEADDEERPEPTCYLFSSVQRPVTQGRAVIYADLVRDAGGVLQPAPHAVLEVSYNPNGDSSSEDSDDEENGDEDANGGQTNGPVWYGIADGVGRTAVQFPLPPVTFESLDNGNGQSGSPRTGSRKSLSKLAAQTWSLNLRVRYEPSALQTPQNADRPLLPSILGQAYGALYGEVSTANSTLHRMLIFGEPLVVTTSGLPDDRSALKVEPASS